MNLSFQIEPKSMIPFYKQIIQSVLDGISQKKISIGMKMPSIHKIREDFSQQANPFKLILRSSL